MYDTALEMKHIKKAACCSWYIRGMLSLRKKVKQPNILIMHQINKPKRTQAMLIRFCFFMLIISLVSCETNENTNNIPCDSKKPLAELKWLKEKQEQIAGNDLIGQIIMYRYKDENVFWIDLCYQCPDGIISVYNCNGEVICAFGGIDGRNTCPEFETEASDSTMLFNNIHN